MFTEEQRNGVKKARTENVSSEKEKKQKVQYQDLDLDEQTAAEVLLNLNTARIDQSRQEIRSRFTFRVSQNLKRVMI